MSVSDPVANMLCQIKNAQQVNKAVVSCNSSKLKLAIVRILLEEGYIDGFKLTADALKPVIEVSLKYYAGRGVIDYFEKISKPGLRVYKGKKVLPKVMGGLGILILSTSRGVMSDRQARSMGLGGEVLCAVA